MNIKHVVTTVVLIMLLSIPLVAISQDRLLIIVPDEFYNEVLPLKSFKDCSARSGIILKLTEIYNNSKYSNSRDNPEKIKKCIADYEKNHGIDYVLLVGDCDRFPVRYCRAYNTEWGAKYYPSDLYYADLYDWNNNFDDWNSDSDGFIGEMDFAGGKNMQIVNIDRIDMYPDIAVARIPASDKTEVSLYVKKIITYEIKAPGNWFKKALFVVDGKQLPFGAPSKKDRLVGYLPGFTILKRYQDQSPWSNRTYDQRAAEINTVINNGVGFVNYFGHGSRTQWTNKYEQGWYDNAKLSGLNNQDHLPVVYAVACYTGRFHFDRDYYLDVTGTEWNGTSPADHPEPRAVQPSKYDKESLAEDFLVKDDVGAIGYIGCVSKHEYGGENLDLHFFEQYYAGVRTLGGLWKNAFNDFIVKEVIPEVMGNYTFIHLHKVMLFGDPSVRVGGAYTTNLSGNVSNSATPIWGYSRYRIVGDVTVPTGQILSADSSASFLFENGRKLTAMDPGANKGFIVNTTPYMPVCFIALSTNTQSKYPIHGIKVNEELRLRNGGAIKLY